MVNSRLIGVVETMKEGADITFSFLWLYTKIVEQAAQELLEVGIDCEIIDVQSFASFDINHDLVKV
jgi:pyruvate/2-oxoglutarate/acetoin dehydrogenase E1 component